MRFDDILRLSLNNLLHRKLRSWLTILGVIIGVAAVVSIISIGSGMQQAISSQLGSLGADVISISPGFSRAAAYGGFSHAPTNGPEAAASKNLTTRDLLAVKSIPGILYADGIISGRADVSYLAKTASVQVQGVDVLAWNSMTTSTLASGRFLTPGDGNSIVIGSGIATQFSKSPLTVNTKITIGGKSFNIVGIMTSSGSFGGSDNAVIMPMAAARTILTNVVPNQLSSIQVKIADANAATTLATTITDKLMIFRHVNTNTQDFTVTSAATIQETISSVMDTMSMFLTGIAAISLLVGAIGIANTMFMSVMERTKQIGVLKALGTTNSEVIRLFLTESATMGLIGGLVGIFLGFIASGIFSEVGFRAIQSAQQAQGVRMATMSTLITPELVIFSLGFSIIIGAISGILPARSAAKLQPIEALRYE